MSHVTSNLVAALVFSRFDYGNALLAGLPHTTLAPLQRVINAAVRLVDGLRPRDHVTAAAMALHWLPVEALFVSPSSTGEKSSNLHHILVTAYHCMPSINGSTIGHR